MRNIANGHSEYKLQYFWRTGEKFQIEQCFAVKCKPSFMLEKLSGFFPQLSIEIKSRRSVADWQVLFAKWSGECRNKREGESTPPCPRESQEMWCLLKGQKERHEVFIRVRGKCSLTPPCWGRNLWRRHSPLVVSQSVGNGWSVLVSPTWRLGPRF